MEQSILVREADARGMVDREVMHPVYMPFTEDELLSHMPESSKDLRENKYFKNIKKGLEDHKRFMAEYPNRGQWTVNDMREPCRIEVDERVWLASTLMTIYHSPDRVKQFSDLFSSAYGDRPPIMNRGADGPDSWEQCFSGDLQLTFEAPMPSPRSYRQWLDQYFKEVHFIPYVLEGKHRAGRLEEKSWVDALLYNPDQQFAVFIEAKVLADIDLDVTCDARRNQMARYIDIMLDSGTPPGRWSERSLFTLLTPAMFRNKHKHSRLYNYKFNEYTQRPDSMADDLEHRRGADWKKVAPRLGWFTWEDCRKVNPQCCPWLR